MTRRNNKQKIFYYTMPGLYEKTIKELETAEEKVCFLLNKYPILRNSDKLLIFYYWLKIDGWQGAIKGPDESLDDNKMLNLNLTSSETIRRVRCKIQNELGLFPPTDESIVFARSIKKESIKDWAIMEKRINRETKTEDIYDNQQNAI